MKQITSQYSLQVPFYDVDSFRIVWHGNYPKYFEVARCQLLEKINYPYRRMEETGYFFPVIDLQIKYVKVIEFEQEIIVSATLKHWLDKLVIDYQIYDANSGDRLTKAQTTQIAVRMPGHITQFQAPAELIENVDAALAEMNES